MTRTDSNDYITLEIAGGPPHVMATVFVGGAVCQHIALNGCGTGSARVTTTSTNPRVEIAIEDLVLLTGRLPLAPSILRSGP